MLFKVVLNLKKNVLNLNLSIRQICFTVLLWHVKVSPREYFELLSCCHGNQNNCPHGNKEASKLITHEQMVSQMCLIVSFIVECIFYVPNIQKWNIYIHFSLILKILYENNNF